MCACKHLVQQACASVEILDTQYGSGSYILGLTTSRVHLNLRCILAASLFRKRYEI